MQATSYECFYLKDEPLIIYYLNQCHDNYVLDLLTKKFQRMTYKDMKDLNAKNQEYK